MRKQVSRLAAVGAVALLAAGCKATDPSQPVDLPNIKVTAINSGAGEFDQTSDTWHLAISTPGIGSFLGVNFRPEDLTPTRCHVVVKNTTSNEVLVDWSPVAVPVPDAPTTYRVVVSTSKVMGIGNYSLDIACGKTYAKTQTLDITESAPPTDGPVPPTDGPVPPTDEPGPPTGDPTL
jgi:hypothetical protein